MFRYHCLNNIAQVGLDKFKEGFEQTQEMTEADGLLVRSANLHDMEFSANLLGIGRAGAGVNNIPLDRCAQEGIVVFNTPGANANGVKELVFAGMLLSARDVVGGVSWVKENQADPAIGKSAEKAKSNFAGTELYDKRLGIIGLGAIGVRVANAARHFGMDVCAYDPYVSVDAAWSVSRDVKYVKDINELYETCDYISLHVPLVDATKGMIGKEQIEKMKEGVVLLNFSRDAIAVETEVLAGIQAGKIKKYVTDFPSTVTAGQEGCLVIPHLGASTEESEENCAKMAVKQLQNYLENGNIINSVNFPNVDLGVCNEKGRVAILHENVVSMIAKFTQDFGDMGVNIAHMANKSKGKMAYTMFDLETAVTPQMAEKLEAIEGVIRVRVVK